ncbi:thiopurine S-methyltransferase [Spartobacteria bacterium LR76]|nr:thiopurine S-methyltransferase [Spartobacteria bacterium LR76]
MDHAFWHDKWATNDIGFHAPIPNTHLVSFLGQLAPAPGARVFVPLCGKTLDIHWLLAGGYHVVGAELSRVAVEQLFADLRVTPQVTPCGALTRFHAPRLDILQGDIFEVSAETLGPVDLVYDRAALVALPGDLRMRYAAHLRAITQHAPQLLVCFHYDQSLMSGPPFSIGEKEVAALYGAHYATERLESVEIAGGLKGLCPATEDVWALRRKAGTAGSR